jgi:hypothetical protein
MIARGIGAWDRCDSSPGRDRRQEAAAREDSLASGQRDRANETYVSFGTSATHARNIYATTLRVGTRDDATAGARELHRQ